MRISKFGRAGVLVALLFCAASASASEQNGSICAPILGSDWPLVSFSPGGLFQNNGSATLTAICPVGGTTFDSTPTLHLDVGFGTGSQGTACTARQTFINGGSIIGSVSGTYNGGATQTLSLGLQVSDPNLFAVSGNVRCALVSGGKISGVSYSWD